jgi:hypothetical protein
MTIPLLFVERETGEWRAPSSKGKSARTMKREWRSPTHGARYDLSKAPRVALEGLGRIENLDDLPTFPGQLQIFEPASNHVHDVLRG